MQSHRCDFRAAIVSEVRMRILSYSYGVIARVVCSQPRYIVLDVAYCRPIPIESVPLSRSKNIVLDCEPWTVFSWRIQKCSIGTRKDFSRSFIHLHTATHSFQRSSDQCNIETVESGTISPTAASTRSFTSPEATTDANAGYSLCETRKLELAVAIAMANGLLQVCDCARRRLHRH